LSKKGHALDAVEAGVRVTESDPENMSVGIGGLPDREGKVTLDACIMDHESNCGAVAFLQEIENPISVARKVMEDTAHVMLAGDGALQFAVEKGFERKNLLTPKAKEAWENWLKESEYKPVINSENHDTIGMLALDEFGNLAGACTTSGMAYKLHGRIGDSPIIGAGLFVDNEVGAACATGVGEAVIRVAGSAIVVELMRNGKSPQEACDEAVNRIINKHKDLENLQVGFIALDKYGNYGSSSVYAGFNMAIKTNSQNELIDAKYKMEWD
jgi:N4-(beta-N-acetylglucosaminyl)-L-asparaginase